MGRTKATARVTTVFSPPRSPKGLALHVTATLMKRRGTLAIVHCPTYCSSEQRRQFWRWIACLLFSGDVHHSVRDVHFPSQPVSADNIIGVREVIQARDPLKHVFALSELGAGGCGESPRWASASHFFLDRPAARRSERTASELRVETRPKPLKVRVMGTTTDPAGRVCWAVLYPDDGIAWVRREDAEIVDNGDGPPPSRQPVPDVFIRGFSDATKDSAMLFLQMIGERVEKLSVYGWYDGSDWCKEVFRACPRLQVLEFAGQIRIRSLQVFVSASSENLCRISNLTISHSCYIRSGGVIELLTTLCDATHPLARRLQVLSLRLLVSRDSPGLLTESVQRLLRLNNRLHTIHLVLFGRPVHALEDLRDNATVRAGPLDIASKISFLKAIERSTGSAIGRFDAVVVSRIFQFAAPHRKRDFCCTFDGVTTVDFEDEGVVVDGGVHGAT